MDDTISRAAVLEIIREYCPDEPKSKDLREYWGKRFEPLIKVREEVEKIPLADRWIPCKERLPGEDDSFYVLCCDTHGEVMIGHVFVCKDGEETPYSAESETEYMYDCLAWMPLPAAYQEGGKE